MALWKKGDMTVMSGTWVRRAAFKGHWLSHDLLLTGEEKAGGRRSSAESHLPALSDAFEARDTDNALGVSSSYSARYLC